MKDGGRNRHREKERRRHRDRHKGKKKEQHIKVIEDMIKQPKKIDGNRKTIRTEDQIKRQTDK